MKFYVKNRKDKTESRKTQRHNFPTVQFCPIQIVIPKHTTLYSLHTHYTLTFLFVNKTFIFLKTDKMKF